MRLICMFAAVVLCLTYTLVAGAQQQLPQPDPAFKGKIGETYKDSTPSYPQPIEAPQGSPNVLIILLDDVGFGMCSTFGGPVPTPHLDKLAKNGLSYTRFHTTALCSPTRGALLAGRNHHSIATGVIIEMGTGFPGYTGIIPRSTALVPQVLRDNGYATSMFGKWHNTPEPDISPTSARPARSTAGRPAWGSTISTASTKARRISTIPRSIATRFPSRSQSRRKRATTSRPT
jgi:arylsulfatase A-like enzyme